MFKKLLDSVYCITIYFRPAKDCSIVEIFVSVSDSFLRSLAITCSGAPFTNFSLDNFPCTERKNPCKYFNSSSNFLISSSTFTEPEIGIKYSLEFTRYDKAPETCSFTYSKWATFPNLVITASKVVGLLSLFNTFKSIISLNEMFLSLRIVLIPEITSVAYSKSAINCSSNDLISGQAETIKASSVERSEMCCQISSVKTGMYGCNNFTFASNISIAALYVAASIGCWYPGLIISKNQEQKSSQTNL